MAEDSLNPSLSSVIEGNRLGWLEATHSADRLFTSELIEQVDKAVLEPLKQRLTFGNSIRYKTIYVSPHEAERSIVSSHWSDTRMGYHFGLQFIIFIIELSQTSIYTRIFT